MFLAIQFCRKSNEERESECSVGRGGSLSVSLWYGTPEPVRPLHRVLHVRVLPVDDDGEQGVRTRDKNDLACGAWST
jgi:hypothetical protein